MKNYDTKNKKFLKKVLSHERSVTRLVYIYYIFNESEGLITSKIERAML